LFDPVVTGGKVDPEPVSDMIESVEPAVGGMTSKIKNIVEQKMKLTKDECSPLVADGEGVCSSNYTINKIRQWLQLPENTPPKKVMEEAMEKTQCTSEACVIQSPMIEELPKKEILRFKPQGPKNNTQWLSNSNIDNVLALIAAQNPSFKHVTFQFIDFQSYGGELAKLDWEGIVKKYKNLGCVINTDHKGNPGKHWICVFVDLVGGTVEYFDSAGQGVPAEIIKWMTETAIELSRITGRKFKDVIVTTMEHQRGETECGVYTLFYISARRAGVPFGFFEHTRVPDQDMEEFREYLFRNV
jgi:hypothetical protein